MNRPAHASGVICFSPIDRQRFGPVACTRVCACFAAVLGLGCPAAESGGSTDGDDATDTEVGDTDTGGVDDWSELLVPVPGSRLRPVVRIADDGTRAHVRWHDTMLGTDCEFRQASDGALRCLPLTATSEPWRYADANCTQPAASPVDLDPDATVVYVREGCFDEVYWEVGAEVTTEIYYDANGPCEVFSNDPGFRRLTPFPVAEFVGASVMPADGESRIVPLVLQADDGARQIVGAWDRVHAQEVEAIADASGTVRWFGRWEPRVSTIYFADPSCILPVAIRECVPPTAQPASAHESAPGACSEATARHQLSGEINAIYQRNDDGTCEPTSLSGASFRIWRVGDALDDGDFAEAPAIEDSGSRLRHDVYANPEGDPVLPSARFVDLLLSELECDWLENPDVPGDLLCEPSGSARISSFFRDAACTERTASRFSFDASCAGGPPVYAFIIGMIAEIVETIASPGEYYVDAAGDCVAEEPGETEGGWDTEEPEYYLVGDPLDIDIAHAMDVVE